MAKPKLLVGGIFKEQQASGIPKSEVEDLRAQIQQEFGDDPAFVQAALDKLDKVTSFDLGRSVLNTTDRLLQQGGEATVGAINATANDPLGTAMNVGTGIANFVGDAAATASDILPSVQTYDQYKQGANNSPRVANTINEAIGGVGDLASGVYNAAIAPGLNALGVGVPEQIAFNKDILTYYDPVTGLPTNRDTALQANPAAGLAQYAPDVAAAVATGGATALASLPAKIGATALVEGGLGALRGSGEGGGTAGDRVLGGAAQGGIGALLEGILGAKPTLRKSAKVTPEEARAAGLTDIYPDAQPRKAPARGMIESKPTRLIASQSSVSPVDMASRLSAGRTNMVPNAPEAWNPQAGVWKPQVKLRTKSAEDSAAVFRKQAEKQRRLNAQKEGALQRGQKHFDYVQEQTGINPLADPKAVVKAYSGMRKADGTLTTKGAKLRNSLVQVRKEAKKSAQLQQDLMQNGRKAKNGGSAVQQAKAEANAAYAEELVNLGNQRSFTAGPDGVELNPSVAEMNKQSAIRKTAERVERAGNPDAPSLDIKTDQDLANQVADVAEAAIVESAPNVARPTSTKGSAALHAVESLRNGGTKADPVRFGKPNNNASFAKQKLQTQSQRILKNDLLPLSRAGAEGATVEERAALAIQQSKDAMRKELLRTPGVDAEATMAALEDGTYEAWRVAGKAGEAVPVSPQVQKGLELVEKQITKFNEETVHPLLRRVDPEVKISSDPAYVSRASEHRTVGTVATKDLSPETVQRIMKANNLKEVPPYIVLEGGATEAEAAALVEGRKGWYSYIAPEVLENPSIVQYRPSAKQRLLDLTDIGEVTPEGYAALREGLAQEGIDITQLDSLLKKLAASTNDDIETLRTIGAIRRQVHSSTLKNTGMKIGLGAEGNSLTRAYTQGKQLANTYSRTIRADEIVNASDAATAKWRQAQGEIEAGNTAAVADRTAAEDAAAVLKEESRRFLGKPTLTDSMIDGAIRYAVANEKNATTVANTIRGGLSLARRLNNVSLLLGNMSSGIANLLEGLPAGVHAFVANPKAAINALDPRVLVPGGRIDRLKAASPYASVYRSFLPVPGLDTAVAGTVDPAFTLRPMLSPRGAADALVKGEAKALLKGTAKAVWQKGNAAITKVGFGIQAGVSHIRQNMAYAVSEAAGKSLGLSGRPLDDYIYEQMLRSRASSDSLHVPLQDDTFGAGVTNLFSWASDSVAQTNDFVRAVISGSDNPSSMDIGRAGLQQRLASAAGLAAHAGVVGTKVLWPIVLADHLLTGDKLFGIFGDQDGIAEGPKLFGQTKPAVSNLKQGKADGSVWSEGLLGQVLNTSNMGFDIASGQRFRDREGNLVLNLSEIASQYTNGAQIALALVNRDIDALREKSLLGRNLSQSSLYKKTGQFVSPTTGKSLYVDPTPDPATAALLVVGLKTDDYSRGQGAVQLEREMSTFDMAFRKVLENKTKVLATAVSQGRTTPEQAQQLLTLLVQQGVESGVMSKDEAAVALSEGLVNAQVSLQDQPSQLGAIDTYKMEDSQLAPKVKAGLAIRKVQNKLEPVTMNKPQLRGIK